MLTLNEVVLSFSSRPLYPMDTKLGQSQSQSGHSGGGEKYWRPCRIRDTISQPLCSYYYSNYAETDVITVIVTENSNFWDVPPCRLWKSTDVSEEQVTSIWTVRQARNQHEAGSKHSPLTFDGLHHVISHKTELNCLSVESQSLIAKVCVT
jgi:hypothetical protein